MSCVTRQEFEVVGGQYSVCQDSAIIKHMYFNILTQWVPDTPFKVSGIWKTGSYEAHIFSER